MTSRTLASSTVDRAPSTPDSRLWALLLMLSGNMLLDALEVSTVVIAMPAVGADLGLGQGGASWLMAGFAIGFGGSILLGQRISARYGRRRMYLAALLVFALASLLSGLAGTAPLLIAMRVVKGVCVALTAPTGLAIIGATFPEGPARNRAVSVYSLFGASGFSIGLLLSGALTLASWRWTLAFAGPVALVLYLAAVRLIPRDGGTPRLPGTDPVPRGQLVRSAAGAASLNGSYWGFLLLATYQLQAHWSPLLAGLALLPTSLPLALIALRAGRIVARVGPRPLIVAGSLATLAAYLWYAAQSADPGYLTGTLPAVCLIGLGFVLSFSALHFQALTGVPPNRQGIVGGVYQTSVQLGGAATLLVVAAGAGASRHVALLAVVAIAAAGVLFAVAGLVAGRR